MCDAKKEIDICCICSEDINKENNTFVTKCNHEFHERCLFKWTDNFENMEDINCPLCRNKLVNDTNTDIFTARPEAKYNNKIHIGTYDISHVIFSTLGEVVFRTPPMIDYGSHMFNYVTETTNNDENNNINNDNELYLQNSETFNVHRPFEDMMGDIFIRFSNEIIRVNRRTHNYSSIFISTRYIRHNENTNENNDDQHGNTTENEDNYNNHIDNVGINNLYYNPDVFQPIISQIIIKEEKIASKERKKVYKEKHKNNNKIIKNQTKQSKLQFKKHKYNNNKINNYPKRIQTYPKRNKK